MWDHPSKLRKPQHWAYFNPTLGASVCRGGQTLLESNQNCCALAFWPEPRWSLSQFSKKIGLAKLSNMYCQKEQVVDFVCWLWWNALHGCCSPSLLFTTEYKLRNYYSFYVILLFSRILRGFISNKPNNSYISLCFWYKVNAIPKVTFIQ